VFLLDILYGQKDFLPPVTYFPTILIDPFNLQVTGVNVKFFTSVQAKLLRSSGISLVFLSFFLFANKASAISSAASSFTREI